MLRQIVTLAAATLTGCIQLPPPLPTADRDSAVGQDTSVTGDTRDATPIHDTDGPADTTTAADTVDPVDTAPTDSGGADSVPLDAAPTDSLSDDADTVAPDCPFGCDDQGDPIAVVGLVAGARHTCARTADQRVICWGSLGDGAVGVGRLHRASAPPSFVPLPGGAAGLTSGARHVCTWDAAGAVNCWGDNRGSQLGVAGGGWRPAPTPVPLEEAAFSCISGDFAVCAYGPVEAAGEPVCWGASFGPFKIEDAEVGAHTALPHASPALRALNPERVAMGAEHACYFDTDAVRLYCFGDNTRGQLGDGTTETRTGPVRVDADALVTPVRAQVAGARHTCAIVGEGWSEVQCWGDNRLDQAGAPSPSLATRPITVDHDFDAPVAALAAGDAFTCALSDGSVVCWGDDDAGQLGAPPAETDGSPHQVAGISDATAIAAGGRHACALLTDGRVLCWGADDDAQLGGGDGPTGLPVEVRYDAALAQRPACDEPGAPIEDTSCRQCGPDARVAGCAFGCDDGDCRAPERLAAGGDHGCALLTSGSAVCWGSNAFGQLASPPEAGEDVRGPTPVPLPALRAIDAGRSHTCAVTTGGRVYCWGRAENGQLGVSTAAPYRSTPSEVPQVSGATHVVTRRDRTCVATDGPGLYCWGDELFLGDDGSVDFEDSPDPVQPVGMGTVHALVMGAQHACALAERDSAGDTRDVFCWGESDRGQLGPEATARATAKPIPGLSSPTLTLLAATSWSTCAWDGTHLYCWGYPEDGTLGPAAFANPDRAQPVDLAGYLDGPVTALAGGQRHFCAAQANGRVRCWGAGAEGELGLVELPAIEATPTVVPGLEGVVDLAAGRGHTCARDEAGLVLCWGADPAGQLGTAPWHAAPTTHPAPWPVGDFAPFPE